MCIALNHHSTGTRHGGDAVQVTAGCHVVRGSLNIYQFFIEVFTVMKRKKTLAFAALLVFAGTSITFSSVFTSPAHGAGSDVQWADELVVFAPLHRSHPVVDGDVLASLPERMEIEAAPEHPLLSLEPKHVNWEPGERVDLEQHIGKNVGDTAYVFIELRSPEAQTVTLGLGADWWIECWMNGEPFFDTLETGNPGGLFSILDNQAEVLLREGVNILAVRFIRGRSSAYLALGEESMFGAEKRRQEELYGLNRLPEKFSDRQVFPERKQAIISSGWEVDLSSPDGELSEGELVGIEPMPERQLYLDEKEADRSGARRGLLDTLSRHFEDEPVKIRLSKYRYPHEDRHLDAIVWTSPSDPETDPSGRIEVRLRGGDGEVLARHDIDELSRNGLFFAVGFPPQLEGSEGALEVVWYDGGTEIGRAQEPFHVREASDVAQSGRIPLEVINEPGAVIRGAPMTTGVPFPRGALEDEANVRLVDENGHEVPLQTKITARWSRFGPIKWLLCDFTADLDGGPRRFYLEYGPDVERRRVDDIAVEHAGAGFPALEAGCIRVNAGGAVEFDAAGDGDFREVLAPEALHGAFVEHENGKVFTMPQDAEHAVEEIGGEKVVVRRAGWYRHADSGEEFCNYVTRFVFHRNSPVVRIFHTWIFTGDGNHDRIANMGWRFPASGIFEPDGLLSGFDDGAWHDSHNLVQFDDRQYDLLGGVERGRRAGRTPGVMSGRSDGTRVTFGAKDFWQNFPSEVEVTDSGLTFYNWPRNNPRATFERPVSGRDAFRNRFVHEGELLDFRLPDEYLSGGIWSGATGSGRYPHWAENRPETANAQGIARTEEMFLCFADVSVGRDEAAGAMQGLNDETLRPVVDPVWVTSSGVFSIGGIDLHPVDKENFPEVERAYKLRMEGPARWVERLGVYGMWLHGDYPTWSIHLPLETVSTYRTYRKNHGDGPGDQPYRMIPFIRSGHPQFLKLAENAARQMADANFCHYASEDVSAAMSEHESVNPRIYWRRQGFWGCSLLPWVGGGRGYAAAFLRTMNISTDSLWDTYYVTGYRRTKDVALLFAELTKHDHMGFGISSGRQSPGILHSYLGIYKATFDPWFLNAVHEIADLHRHQYRTHSHRDRDTLRYGWPGSTGFRSDHWKWADQAFHAFIGCDEYQEVARASAQAHANPNIVVRAAGTGSSGGADAGLSAHAWRHTGDPVYLGLLSAALDRLQLTSYDGDIEWALGPPLSSHGWHACAATYSSDYAIPMAMTILSGLDETPDPIHTATWLRSGGWPGSPDAVVHIWHEGERDRFDLHFLVRGAGLPEQFFEYSITGPEGFRLEDEAETPETIEVAGERGVYRVEARGAISNLYLPLARYNIPEVIEFKTSEDGTRVTAPRIGYWFYVPEGVEAFRIDFTDTPRPRNYVNRVSVWAPDGERVWDHSYSVEDDPPTPPRATISVPEGMDGKLWRATGGNFTIDPKIPPYFSLSGDKWFDPGE